jgi:hypothetical protein
MQATFGVLAALMIAGTFLYFTNGDDSPRRHTLTLEVSGSPGPAIVNVISASGSSQHPVPIPYTVNVTEQDGSRVAISVTRSDFVGDSLSCQVRDGTRIISTQTATGPGAVCAAAATVGQ